MKRRRVMKLFSLSMAGVLAASSVSMAGGTVYASEQSAAQEEAVQSEVVEEEVKEEVKEDTQKGSEEEAQEQEDKSSSEIVEQKENSEQDSSETDGFKEDNSKEDSLEEDNDEETTEESVEEETAEEITTLEEEEVALLFSLEEINALSEDVELHQFYGKELVFDQTSDWSDQGECNLGLSSDQILNSGAKISFDIYILEEAADYNGVIKVQGAARLGDTWEWTENKSIPEFASANLVDTVEVGGKLYKKTNVSFTFGEEITTDYLKEFTVKLAGWQCDYEGSIYFANVTLQDGEAKEEEEQGETAGNVVQLWNFEEGIDGWYYDGTWDNDGDNSIEWNEQYQALQMNVDYSKNADSTWSEIKSSFWGNDFTVSGVNKLTFDFIYDSAKLQKGMLKAKVFSNNGVNTDVTMNLENAEDYDGTLKKVQVSFSFDEKDIVNGLTLGIIGYETDYQGVVYLDNVSLISEAEQKEDIYVDATESATGQNIQLSVQGNTLVTGAGSSEIAQNITLVDANATDDVKQIYAYLQAVGKTDSVIFGQQNNTSHKAGSSDLSCSDTMDMVGSYAGVIGIDGLSFTGNEYSAERYINEMSERDSEYASVVAKIAQAQTVAEKNVIAAAALTNYNIRNGAIATLSLHTPNLSKVNKVNASAGAPSYASYDFSGYTPGNLSGDVMNNILPGGAYNDEFTAYLDMVADYAKQVDGAILFRPFHENTGSWFWWGAALCDAQTYKSVYKYTVEYLRDEKGVHNLLYVYGPGSEAASTEEYAVRYPGDGYVDMVGFDMYHDNPTEGDSFIASFTKELSIVESFAKEHGKLVAVTETGTRHDTVQGDNQTALLKQNNERADWHQEILDAVKASDASYYLVWANFGEKDGFYTPYVKSVKEDGTLHGHEMMDNFIRFFNQDASVFAVNQKQALNQMKSLSVQADPAVVQDGYIVSPIAGTRVLEETTLTAKVSSVTEEDKVEFVCKGAEQTRTLKATVANGYAVAGLTADDLAAMGEYVGTITLQINGTTVDTVRVTFNIPEPIADPYEIDSFENYYGVDSQLTKAWTTNKASGSSIQLLLVQDEVNEGDYALKFAYQETSDGWAGATITKEVSWADCDALSFWTIPDGNLQKTVIQITANGNVYEYYMNLNEDYALAGAQAVYVTIPFEEFVDRDITGNPAGGLEKDKGNITSFGLWVNAIAGSDAVDEDGMVNGVIYYDSITAVSAGLDTAKVVLAKENKPEDNPVKPEYKPETGSSQGDGESGNNTNEVADIRVFPTFVGIDGVIAKGWDDVASSAYELAKLNASQVPLASTPDEAVQRLAVNINASDVTELVIPLKTIRKMEATGADYNIFMNDMAVTLTSELLAGVEGDLDLKLYERYVKDFGAGFDARFISSRARQKLTQQANMNVVLGEEKAGRQAYIYKFSEENHKYDLLMTQTVSEIGTVCIPVDEYVSCLILY